VSAEAFIPRARPRCSWPARSRAPVWPDPIKIFNLVPHLGAPAGVVDASLKQPLFPSCVANCSPTPPRFPA
jgi:hypothetical protein